jgi:uncharacterized surface protein with fasciclin (FAS1) repeats
MNRKFVLAIAVVLLAIAMWAIATRDESSTTPPDRAKPTTTLATRPGLPPSASLTIHELLTRDAQYSKFRQYADDSGVGRRLEEKGPWTVLAPSVKAFAAAQPGSIEDLLTDPKGLLASFVSRHVLRGSYPYSKLQTMSGKTVTAVDGTRLPVTVNNGVVSVGGVTIAKYDIQAKNGLIDVVDTVIPATAAP